MVLIHPTETGQTGSQANLPHLLAQRIKGAGDLPVGDVFPVQLIVQVIVPAVTEINGNGPGPEPLRRRQFNLQELRYAAFPWNPKNLHQKSSCIET